MEPNGKKCVYIFKKGKSKGTTCNRVVSVETGDLCNKHFKETGGVYPDDNVASEPPLQDPPIQQPKKVKINVLKNEVFEIPDDTVILELPPVEEDIPEQDEIPQEQEQEPSIPEDRQIDLDMLYVMYNPTVYLISSRVSAVMGNCSSGPSISVKYGPISW
jgi:hypothetical protein